jgi:hypothetical protein
LNGNKQYDVERKFFAEMQIQELIVDVIVGDIRQTSIADGAAGRRGAAAAGGENCA